MMIGVGSLTEVLNQYFVTPVEPHVSFFNGIFITFDSLVIRFEPFTNM